VRLVACSYYHSLFVAENSAVFGCGRNESCQLGLSRAAYPASDVHEATLVLPLHEPAYCAAVRLQRQRLPLTDGADAVDADGGGSRGGNADVVDDEDEEAWTPDVLPNTTADARVYRSEANAFDARRRAAVGLPPHEQEERAAAAASADAAGDGCWVRSIAAGQYHSVIVLADGRVFATGRNDWGQTGLESPGCSRLFTRVTGGACSAPRTVWQRRRREMAAELAAATAGSPFPAALLPTKAVPVPIAAAACGYYHTLLLTACGRVIAFGRHDSGMCGIGSSTPKVFVPRLVHMPPPPAPAPAAAASAGTPSRSPRSSPAGTPSRPGAGAGFLGGSASPPTSPQTQQLSFHGVLAGGRTSGDGLSLPSPASSGATGSSGVLAATGGGPSRVVAMLSAQASLQNGVLPSEQRAWIIAAGCYHSVAVTGSGAAQRVVAFGRNQHGQLGLGDTAERFVPAVVLLPGLSQPPPMPAHGSQPADGGAAPAGGGSCVAEVVNVVGLAAGFYHTVFLTAPVHAQASHERKHASSTAADEAGAADARALDALVWRVGAATGVLPLRVVVLLVARRLAQEGISPPATRQLVDTLAATVLVATGTGTSSGIGIDAPVSASVSVTPAVTLTARPQLQSPTPLGSPAHSAVPTATSAISASGARAVTPAASPGGPLPSLTRTPSSLQRGGASAAGACHAASSASLPPIVSAPSLASPLTPASMLGQPRARRHPAAAAEREQHAEPAGRVARAAVTGRH
jgi:alpha-tubulin suppressor-like RCC1 family protein